MNRVAVKFFSVHPPTLINQLLQWANDFRYVAFLNSNEYNNTGYGRYDVVLAVADEKINFEKNTNRFSQLKKKYNEKDWLFGYLSYDLKNDVENLSSANPDQLGLPEIFFFQPKYIFTLSKNEVTIHSSEGNHEQLFNLISSINVKEANDFKLDATLQQRTDKKTYIKNVNEIREQIIKGDYYELNYCMQFFAEAVKTNPLELYKQFNLVSPAPFSAFIRLDDNYILSASPERFLRKDGNRLISQPIKGTRRRNLDNKEEDQKLMKELAESEKERAENIMIVDLVRNDLNRSAVTGSVKAEELCGIYSFPQVHQMISTVSSNIRSDVHAVDAIKYAFPMGSMTGAPKVEVMKAIEYYEDTKRGVYSGAIGYFEPSGNFDFSVVIRSIIYNQSASFLSYHAGSAITFDADAESEYAECLLKTKPIKQLISEE